MCHALRVAPDVSGPADLVQRKQARPTRARGKAGYRRLEAVLESANIVVQRVETENDIGRDAFVDIVDGTEVTGGVICVQVKSGRKSYFYDGNWLIPGKPADFTLWRIVISLPMPILAGALGRFVYVRVRHRFKL